MAGIVTRVLRLSRNKLIQLPCGLTGVLARILTRLGLPVVGCLGEMSVTVRIDWVELEQIRQWEQFADGRRFTLGGVIDQLGDDERSGHANTQTQGSGCQRGRVLVGDEARGGRAGLCKEEI